MVVVWDGIYILVAVYNLHPVIIRYISVNKPQIHISNFDH